jgi:hypothetical protein
VQVGNIRGYMPIYKNWQDFDAMHDKSRVLVIYGAGYNGLRFLNFHKVIPDYFCDRDARKIKGMEHAGGGGLIPVLTLKELLAELNGRDADILVSNLNEEAIKSLHRIFNKIKFTENTVIYFHHFYYVIGRKIIRKLLPPVAINDKYVSSGYIIFDKSIGEKFNLLKDAYFDGDTLSIGEFINIRQQRRWKNIFRNGRIVYENRLQYYPENLKTSGENQTIYFFGDCRLLESYSKSECGIEFIMSELLDKNEKTNYKIENYSQGRFKDEGIIFQLTNASLIRSSIVIINSIYEPYLLSIAKRYCQKYDCRLIYYYMPSIYFKKSLSGWEKLFLEEERLTNVDIRKKQLESIAKAMDIEFYEPPDDFLNSYKTIFLDNIHFADYGNEIIAKHLYNIITNKVNLDNSCSDFCMNIKDKTEYANKAISFVMPEINDYLAGLKKYKQNFENCGTIVMNCNPFTLGHRHLIEYAAGKAEHLYIFVVEEDKSEFSFADRYKLVKKNTSDLKNVTVLLSGKFIISSVTFAGYFEKSDTSEEQAAEQDVGLDLLIFAAAIAPELNIKTRFVGQEPFDHVTRHYNEEMKKILPEYGCEVVEIPRLEENGNAVSASRVRKLLKERNFEEIKKIVPKATLRYLKSRKIDS